MTIMKDLENLERDLFSAESVTLREIKNGRYKDYNYDGVYAIHQNGKLVKIGKTKGTTGKETKENRLADRLWGLTLANSILREEMRWTREEAEACAARCLRVDCPLLRGRLEYFLIAKHCPPVNKRELTR